MLRSAHLGDLAEVGLDHPFPVVGMILAGDPLTFPVFLSSEGGAASVSRLLVNFFCKGVLIIS